MSADYVLDTNVIMHAYDPRQPCRNAAKRILAHVLAEERPIRVDAPMGGRPSEGYIWAEYEARGLLKPTHLAYQFFLAAIKSKLVATAVYSRDPAFRNLHKCLRDKTDRRFIQTAAAATARHLVSDDKAFHPVRSEQSRRLAAICTRTLVRITREGDALDPTR
jgi:predicted nucleic acid-binding protein